MNTEHQEYIFTVLEKAKVTISDFSRITKISRNTLHKWRRKQQASDVIRFDLAYSTAAALDTAVKRGMLPMEARYTTGRRVAILTAIIKSCK